MPALRASLIHTSLPSDRMSRSELTLLSRSCPTASQVIMTVSKKAISEGKKLNFHGVRCKWAGCAAWAANGVWQWQWLASPLDSLLLFPWCLRFGAACFQSGWPRNFWSLPAQPPLARWETRRLDSTSGLQW